MKRTRVLSALVLAMSVSILGSSCAQKAEEGGGSGGSTGSGGSGSGGSSSGSGGLGSGGSTSTGGTTGTGGSTSTGGTTGTGGTTSTGGTTGTGGTTSTGGTTGTGGTPADAAAGETGGGPLAAMFKKQCFFPVMTGWAPDEFCEAYGEICTFGGAQRYKDLADCKAKFKGLSSDADGCKAGHLCRAWKEPAMKEMDCASSSGAIACKN
jgi:hypothetical protein